MAKYNFILIGTGWRSLFYVRIAKALPEIFNLMAVYSRTSEKAEIFSKENGVHTTTSIEECKNLKPDFVVTAVKKSEGVKIAKQWLEYGFTVLAETPAGFDEENLKEVQKIQQEGKNLFFAEQYIFYPQYAALLKLLSTGIIGKVNFVSISCAHEYHGASLIRHFLDENSLPLKIESKSFLFPTVETLTRYENFTDGRIKDKKRTVSLLQFQNNKVALYDFDSEQYRSPIRKNLLKIQGVRGEIHDDTVFWLDENNAPKQSQIQIETRTLETEDTNPNLHFVTEIEKITFEGKILYEPKFGLCGLGQDETAIATVMEGIGRFAKGEISSPYYSLEEAIMDSQMGLEIIG